MNELQVTNMDGMIVVSSRVVAQNFNKRHSDVTEIIRKLTAENSAVKHMMIERTFDHKGNTYTEYFLNRDGFSLLVMGFTGKEALDWKIQYIEAFNKMEAMIMSNNQLATNSEMSKTIVVLNEKIQDLESKFNTLYSRFQELETKTTKQLAAPKVKEETYIEKLIKELESISNEREQVKLFHRAMLEHNGFSVTEIKEYGLKKYIYVYDRLCSSTSDFTTINGRIRSRNLSGVPNEPNLLEPIY